MNFVGKLLFAILAPSFLLHPKSASEPTVNHVHLGSKFKAADLIGSYYFGDGLSVNCTMEIRSGKEFAFKWTGCLGEYDRNRGSFEICGDEIVMHPQQPNKHDGFQGMDERFVPVKWGTRMFLVAENEMLGFTSSAKEWMLSGRFPSRSFSYYLRYDGNPRSASTALPKGKPELPDLYQKYLEHPLQVKVVKVTEEEAEIDKGSADGVAVGTRLNPPQSMFCWYVVEHVTAHSATLKRWKTEDPRPTVGEVLIPYIL